MKTTKSPSLAEVAIRYKTKVSVNQMPRIKNSADVYEQLQKIYNKETVQHHEEVVILMLNTANLVLGWAKISFGGISSAIIDPRIVFQYAIKCNAVGIILSHNHPSGQTKPSTQDRLITKKISEGGKILDINLMDHIIYTEKEYYSFADEGEI